MTLRSWKSVVVPSSWPTLPSGPHAGHLVMCLLRVWLVAACCGGRYTRDSLYSQMPEDTDFENLIFPVSRTFVVVGVNQPLVRLYHTLLAPLSRLSGLLPDRQEQPGSRKTMRLLRVVLTHTCAGGQVLVLEPAGHGRGPPRAGRAHHQLLLQPARGIRCVRPALAMRPDEQAKSLKECVTGRWVVCVGMGVMLQARGTCLPCPRPASCTPRPSPATASRTSPTARSSPHGRFRPTARCGRTDTPAH